MDKAKHLTHQENNTGITPVMYWGNIALGLIGLVSVGLTLAGMLQLPRTGVVYFAVSMYALTIAAAIAVIILTIRNRQDLGAQLAFCMALLIFLSSPVIFAGRGLTASFSLVTISAIVILQLLPKTARRSRYFILIGAALILMWTLEWINPLWRLQTEVGKIGPATAIIFGIILAVILVREAWSLITYSISNRLTALVLVVTIPLLIGITAYISFRAGNEIEAQALHNLDQNNKSLATNVSTWLELHVRTAKELATLPDITSMDPSRQKLTLQIIASAHPNLFLIHTTDLKGINVARSDDAELNDYHDRAWFLGAISGAPVTYEALISRTIGKPALNIAVPIYDGADKLVGVASIVSELSEISEEVLSKEDKQGITYIVDAKNRVVAHPDPSYTEGELRDLSTYPPVAALNEGKTGQVTFTDETGLTWVAYVDRLGNGWGIVAQQPESELLAPVRQFQTVSIILILIGSGVMFALAWFAIRRSLQPIGTLTATVSAIAKGDLNRMAEVKTEDEIGVLASTFNEMTTKLRETLVTLEQRVTDRTKALATSTEVSRRLSTILNQKELVAEVVNQVTNAFGYYHTQIYFYDASNENLVMAGGTGEAGKMMLAQFHKVAKGRGLVGRAAESNKSVLVSNTSQNPEWLPNPLLPETKSEMAIPISIGNQVLGVLDVQHNVADGLQQEDVDTLQSIANQVAVAIQNIQSTENIAKRAKELQTVANISTAAATISNIEKMLQEVVHLTQRGFGLYHAHVFIYNENTAELQIAACGYKEGDEHEGTHGTTVIPLAQEQSLVARAGRTRQAVIVNNVRNEAGWLPNPMLPDTASELAVPMIVGDQLLGVLDVQSERLNAFTSEDASIQSTLASQIATALQNARSLTQSQRQAERETAMNLIVQKIQSTTSIEAALQIAARELGHALGMKSTLVELKHEALAGDQNVKTEPIRTGVLK